MKATLKNSSSSAVAGKRSTTLQVDPIAHPAMVNSVGRINAEEIKRLIQVGRERGLVKGGESGPAKIVKDGLDVSSLDSVKCQWMDITPAMAGTWLRNNFRNRPLDHHTVKAYARDMVNGVWVPTHQGIAFNDKDDLIDGQHRLHAIVACGKTVRMMVTFGLPSKINGHEMTTMDAVDRGRTRSVADQLNIQHGMKHGSITASICSAIATLCYGERTRRLSVGQTLDVYRTFEPAVGWIIAHRSKEYGLRSCGVLAGFAFALMPHYDKKASISDLPLGRMFRALNSGEGFAPGSVTELLRNFLTSEESKLFTKSLDRGLAELVLQAIWLELNGQKVVKLEPGMEGAEHFKSLQSDRVAKTAALFTLPK